MNAHSEKALKTISLMSTKPDDWALTPIKWVKEKIMWDVVKECPTCRGRGRATTYLDGTPYRYDKDSKMRKALKLKKDDWVPHDKEQAYRKKHGIDYRRCPTCPQKKSRNFGPVEVGTGKIVVREMVEMLVGYPQWAKGTLFDSRFHDGIYQGNRIANVRHVCELCSKSITGRWSFLVPVNARGKDGKIHGMWVGQDCSKKFLGIELVLDELQLEGVKKSELKQRVMIRMEAGK